MRPVADVQRDGCQSLPARAQQLLYVDQRCPLTADQNAGQTGSVHPDTFRQLSERGLVFPNVAPDDPSNLILNTGRAGLRRRVIWPHHPGYMELPETVLAVVVRRGGMTHLNLRLCSPEQPVISLWWHSPYQNAPRMRAYVSTPSEIISHYQSTLPADTWAAVRSLVIDTVTAAYTDADHPRAAQRALGAMSGFADWVLVTGVGAPDRTVLRADIIEAYCAFRRTELKASGAERERKLLRSLAGLDNEVEVRPHTTSAESSHPYDLDAQGAFRRWADAQPSAHRHRLTTAVLALGFGCGLTLSELQQVRNADIVTLADGQPGVHIAGRLVPALAVWTDELAAVVRGDDDGFVVRPDAPARSIATFNDAMGRLDGVAPSPQRMRATWLLTHVEAGTPVHILVKAAGLKGADVLRRILPHVGPVNEDTAVRALRAANGGVR